jgi:hypothetical protein
MCRKVITLLVGLAGMASAGLAVGAEQQAGQGQEGSAAPTDGDTGANPRRLGGAAQTKTETATVKSIDRDNRTVTLKDDKGKTMTVDVPTDVQSFDKLKKGDKIRMTYKESVAVSVHRAGASAPSADVQERTGRTTGANPTGNIERTHTVSGEVVSVDPARNKLTVKGPEGRMRDIDVEDPAIRQQLKTLHPGEVVELKYTENMAVSLEPKK